MDIVTAQLFECLYLLDNSEFYLLEIKRNDLSDYAPISEKFKWLKIAKQDLSTVQMTFRSMDASDQIEERYFEEGFLKFNSEEGTFIEKYNSAQHALTNKSGEELPYLLSNHIREFLVQK